MSDNSVKIYGVFNEEGLLLCAFTDEFEMQDYVMELEDNEQTVYVTTGTIELPTIEEEEE